MNEFDILDRISSTLAERKCSAALNNYQVLCSNIKYVNEVLIHAIYAFSGIHTTAGQALTTDANCETDYASGNPVAPFTKIAPRVISNGIAVLQKFALQTEPDDRSGISVNNVSRLHRGFIEYNRLVTASRQVVDSLVSDAYQLRMLDPRSLNHHVLVSLNSFEKYVTPSIHQALFSEQLEAALDEFRKLKFKEWNNSPITRCDHPHFGQKVDALLLDIGIPTTDPLGDELKDLFKFASEFTHIGYVSTFFSASSGAEVIFGDEVGPYLPSTENFSELKYQLLETVVRLVTRVYFPSVACCWRKMLRAHISGGLDNSLKELVGALADHLKTRNAQYYFFIKKGIIGCEKSVDLSCMCGATRAWGPPHKSDDLYCKACGSHFNLLEVDGDGGYIITSSGPTRILGSDAPDFKDLPEAEQLRMFKQIDTLLRKKAEE